MLSKNNLIKEVAKLDKILASLTGKFKIKFNLAETIFNQKSISNQKKNPKVCIVYLVSPRERMHEKGFMNYPRVVSKLEIFKDSLKTAVKYLPNYPIYIFHEDYTIADKNKVQKYAKDRKLIFVKVNFDLYKGKTNLDEWMKKQKGFVEGRPAGYRMMCRFFCGVMQNSKEVSKFDYYIRLDHDSFFIEPNKLNIENCIKKYNFEYLFRSYFTDRKEKDALWEFTKNFAKRNNLSLEGFKQLGMLDSRGNYNGLCPYNNFHASKVSFWKRKDVSNYLQEMETIDGIIKLHWQDANVHAMLMGLFNPIILEKTDFGYMHNFHYSILGSTKIRFLKGKEAEKVIKLI